jgi:hypothetical protein
MNGISNDYVAMQLHKARERELQNKVNHEHLVEEAEKANEGFRIPFFRLPKMKINNN